MPTPIPAHNSIPSRQVNSALSTLPFFDRSSQILQSIWCHFRLPRALSPIVPRGARRTAPQVTTFKNTNPVQYVTP